MTVETTSRIKELVEKAETDSSGRWVPTTSLEKYTEAVIKECIAVVKETPTHCAFTTHDIGIVQCTIDKSITHIKQHFNL